MNKLVCPKGIIEISVARTFFGRFLGLMFIPQESFCGGLFIPKCSSIHTFFMHFCIDVIFLDKTSKVIKIVKNIKPWRVILPVRLAKAVIELKADFADKYGIKEGITLSLDD